MKILVVGLGLMGGAYAYKLKNVGHTVYGVDINNDSVKYGIDNNFIDDGGIDAKDFILKSDLIILAFYPKQIVEFLKKYNIYFNENQIITDIAGIKSCFVEEAMKYALPATYISHHPMAGKEKIGIEYSKLVNFKNSNFLITTTKDTKKEKIEIIEKIARDLEFGKITKLDIYEHDNFIAFTSQLPHAIAVSLMNCNVSKDITNCVGDSFKDFTRIARINEKLWTELFINNKEYLINKINDFEKELDRIKDSLINENKDTLNDMFKFATKIRKEMDENEGTKN